MKSQGEPGKEHPAVWASEFQTLRKLKGQHLVLFKGLFTPALGLLQRLMGGPSPSQWGGAACSCEGRGASSGVLHSCPRPHPGSTSGDTEAQPLVVASHTFSRGSSSFPCQAISGHAPAAPTTTAPCLSPGSETGQFRGTTAARPGPGHQFRGPPPAAPHPLPALLRLEYHGLRRDGPGLPPPCPHACAGLISWTVRVASQDVRALSQSCNQQRLPRTSKRAPPFHHKQQHDMGIRTGLGEGCCPRDRRIRDKRSQPLPAGQPAGHPNQGCLGDTVGGAGRRKGWGSSFQNQPTSHLPASSFPRREGGGAPPLAYGPSSLQGWHTGEPSRAGSLPVLCLSTRGAGSFRRME